MGPQRETVAAPGRGVAFRKVKRSRPFREPLLRAPIS